MSTQYRLRLEGICKKIVNGESVDLSDMIQTEKLGKANTTANEWLKKVRDRKQPILICRKVVWMIL